MLPNFLIARTYLVRSFGLWLAIRLLLAVAGAIATSNPIRLPAAATVFVVVLTVLVAFMDTRWRHESVLLGNLGISGVTLAALFAIPPLVGEVVVHALVAQ